MTAPDEPGPERAAVPRPHTTSRDTITVVPDGSGSSVDYQAEFPFTGLGRWLWPVAIPLLNELGNDTARTLKTALDRR
jgi:hypothetical protein